jgi:hypothetical protein
MTRYQSGIVQPRTQRLRSIPQLSILMHIVLDYQLPIRLLMSGDGPVSFIDIERAAYVLRNLAISDYSASQEAEAGFFVLLLRLVPSSLESFSDSFGSGSFADSTSFTTEQCRWGEFRGWTCLVYRHREGCLCAPQSRNLGLLLMHIVLDYQLPIRLLMFRRLLLLNIRTLWEIH